MTTKSAPLTREQAAKLTTTLVEKMAQRAAAIAIEAGVAVELVQPGESECPPPWALNAIRVCCEWLTELFDIKDKNVKAHQAGAMLALGRTWRAFLEQPSTETQELEKNSPLLVELRARMAEISQPQLDLAEKLAVHVKQVPLTAKDRLELVKGQVAVTTEFFTDQGELREGKSIRTEVCFWLWLYWKEIRFLETMTELEKFFQEFREDSITRKNLEKICAEIGLSFKKRGRPKKPTSSLKSVGIKKKRSGVKRGNANSRLRKKS